MVMSEAQSISLIPQKKDHVKGRYRELLIELIPHNTKYLNFLDSTGGGAISGIRLFFFDPLLSVDWGLIERIAKQRITYPIIPGLQWFEIN